jgi:microcystin-dependent protein
MVSTFTPNKNLELPGYNDYVNNWNTPNNSNYSALDAALGGATGLNATGLSGNVILTVNQYRPPMIFIGGAINANVRYVITANVGGEWTIVNYTTGNYTISIASAAGGYDVLLPSNSATIVFCDGSSSGMRRAVDNLPTVNGGTGLRSAPTTGQLLIGNSSGQYSLSTLTAGNGIFITNGEGTITISSPVSIPTGMVSPFAGYSAPYGWLLCDGSSVSRSIYSSLFSIIGTGYGSGDGSTTFNVPDLRGRAAFGRDDMGGTAANRITADVSGISGTTIGASGGDQVVGNHTHGVNDPTHSHGLNDPSHNHGYNDPGHSHGVSISGGSQGHGGLTPVAAEYGASNTNTANTNIAIASAYTGIGVNGNSTGITIASGGGGTGANIPPAIIMNYIIKT